MLPKAIIFFFGLVSVLFIAGACSDDADDTDGDNGPITRGPSIDIVIAADEPIIIGISAALTGPIESFGTIGRDATIVGVERWKAANGDQIAGHDIEIRAEDDGCFEADITAQAAERLLRVKGLVGVIGPICSDGAAAVIPAYAAAGIVSISGSATANSLTDDQPEGHFFFRTAYRNDLEGTLIGLFLVAYERVHIIDDGGTYSQDLGDSAQQIAEDGGVSVTRESIAVGTVDFSALAERIAQENPDFVGFTGFNPEAALLYRQLRDAGYAGVFGAGDGAASVTGFVEPVGAAEAEGVLFAGCQFPLPQDFLDEFVTLHGYEPVMPFTAQYPDAATILLDAVAKVAEEQADGSLVIDPIELRDAVRASVLEDGLSGAIAFNEDGDRVPPGAVSLEEFVSTSLAALDNSGYIDLGLIPCQVQDGVLVNLIGPNAGEIRLP